MRHVTRGMWATLVAAVCLVTWSAAGRQNSSRGNSSVPVDQTSIGGTVVNSDGGKPTVTVSQCSAGSRARMLPVAST